jgi:hypothetical protein
MRLLSTYPKPLSASALADNGFCYPHPHVRIAGSGCVRIADVDN